MSLSDTIYTILSNAASLTALVGDRIDRDRQMDSTLPNVVYAAHVDQDDAAYRDQDGAPGRAVFTAQFNCYGSTANEASDVAAEITSLFSGYQSDAQDIGYAFVANRIDDGYDAGLDSYRVIVDVSIETGDLA